MNHLCHRVRAGVLLSVLGLIGGCSTPPTPARSAPRLARPATPRAATPPRAPSPQRVAALADLDALWVERSRIANLYDGAQVFVLARALDATGPTTRANTRTVVVTLGDRSGSQGPDRDRDGLSDAAEERIGTNPDNADSDGDSLPDAFELFGLGTRPLVADSDGDGVPDNREVNLDDPNTYADSDGDGFGDGEEVAHLNTDPRSLDSDGDGFGDDLEFLYGTAMNDRSDPDLDTDGDGEPNDYEQANGEDPNSDESQGADSDRDDVPDWLDRDTAGMARVRGRQGAVPANSIDCNPNSNGAGRT